MSETSPRPETSVVVVPDAPGPLLPVVASQTREADDLDEIIDEIFGETTDERPGWFDLALFGGGAGLLSWALVADASGLALAGGIAAMVLGSALPVRSLARRLRSGRAHRKERRLMAKGYSLDLAHPSTRELAQAYEDLCAAAARDGVLLADRAVRAAHLAVVEGASLLDGAAPVADAQIDYLELRTSAIGRLTTQLQRQHREWIDSREAEAALAEQERRARAIAVTQARDELGEGTRLGSLDELGLLAQQFEEDGKRASG